MLDRRSWLRTLTTAVATGWLVGLSGCGDTEGQNMQKISFDLGRNIVDTASGSGVPKYQYRDVDGYVSYTVDHIPPQILARYARAGYEIEWGPLHALTMYADHEENPKLLVETVVLQLSRDKQATHESVQAFIEHTLAQFQRGKWSRYVNSDSEVLMTGRSSILNEQGQLSDDLSAIDPSYKIPTVEWPDLANQGLTWRWIGDGVIATLHVSNLPNKAVGDVNYDIDLEFDSQKVYEARLAKELAHRLKEGDANGMKLTAKHEADKKARQALNQRLIENAIKRGDAIYLPPSGL